MHAAHSAIRSKSLRQSPSGCAASWNGRCCYPSGMQGVGSAEREPSSEQCLGWSAPTQWIMTRVDARHYRIVIQGNNSSSATAEVAKTAVLGSAFIHMLGHASVLGVLRTGPPTDVHY
jgi:hypothetical protein